MTKNYEFCCRNRDKGGRVSPEWPERECDL